MNIEFPNIKWNLIELLPTNKNIKDLCIFFIPINSHVQYLKITMNQCCGFLPHHIIQWIYGDKVIIDKHTLCPLSIKINMEQMYTIHNYSILDSFHPDFGNHMYIKHKNVLKINMHMFSCCSDIKIKLINTNILQCITQIELIVNQKVKNVYVNTTNLAVKKISK
jgi:hypothetical protein